MPQVSALTSSVFSKRYTCGWGGGRGEHYPFFLWLLTHPQFLEERLRSLTEGKGTMTVDLEQR